LLQSAFGVYGMALWKHAHGLDLNFHVSLPESKSISREVTLDHDTTDERYLGAVLHLLMEKATHELRKTKRKAKTVTVRIRYSDFRKISRAGTLEKATNLDEVIYRKAIELLQQGRHRRVRVRLIGIHLSHFEPETGQYELFPDAGEDRARNLYEKVDGVRDRFGFESLQTGQSIFLGK